jgi:hypothetical protein
VPRPTDRGRQDYPTPAGARLLPVKLSPELDILLQTG